MTNEPYLVTTKQHMRTVMELHSTCGWSPDEQTRLTHYISGTNCVAFLLGDEEPIGYIMAYIQEQDKVAKGLWAGILPDQRGGGKYRKLFLALINECRARGAIAYDSYVPEDNPTSARTIRMHEKLGFTFVESFPDHAFVEGKKIECTTHYFRLDYR